MYRRTAEEIRAQKQELALRAEKGLEALAEKLIADSTTAALESWLVFAGRFHRYSLRNLVLIHQQRPDASFCAGFQSWKALGRSVKKGERGIAILAPAGQARRVEREQDPESGAVEEKVVGSFQRYRVTHIFDVAQTEGEDLPRHPAQN